MPDLKSEYEYSILTLEERARRREHRAFMLRALFIFFAGATSAGLIGVGGYIALRPLSPNEQPVFNLILLFVSSGIFLLLFAGMVALLRFGSDNQEKYSSERPYK